MKKFFAAVILSTANLFGNRDFDEKDLMKFMKRNLLQGKPIIFENVEFGRHRRVVIGCDDLGTPEELYDDVLIFVDPFDTSDHKQDGYTCGSLDRFYWMWFDKRERNQPWLVATPD